VAEVVDYCANDVRATEAVFEDRKGDFVARQILAELSGLTVNDTTQQHTAKIILGRGGNPKRQFVYTDLSKNSLATNLSSARAHTRVRIPERAGTSIPNPEYTKM
jgi:hypothetical protein